MKPDASRVRASKPRRIRALDSSSLIGCSGGGDELIRTADISPALAFPNCTHEITTSFCSRRLRCHSR